MRKSDCPFFSFAVAGLACRAAGSRLARRLLAPETMSFSAAGRVAPEEEYRRILGL